MAALYADSFAEEIPECRFSHEADVVVYEFDSEENIDFKSAATEAIALSDRSVLYAFAKCQYDLCVRRTLDSIS